MKFLLFIILIALTIDVFGQSRGSVYMKDKKDSTVLRAFPGMITFNSKQPGSVKLKPDTGADPIVFKAGVVPGFSAGTNKFVSRRDATTQEYIFAEVVYEGAVTVARLNTLYILTKGDGSEVQFHLSKRGVPAFAGMTEQQTIGLISEFLNDCSVPNITERLQNISAPEVGRSHTSGLISVLEDYNACKGAKLLRMTRAAIRVGVFGGVQRSALRFQDDALNHFDRKASGVVGFDLDIIPASFHRRSSLNIGIAWWTNVHHHTPDAPVTLAAADLTYKNWRVPVSLKIYSRPGHSGFFFQPGLAASFNTIPTTTLDNHFKSISNATLYGLFGIGWEKSRDRRQWWLLSLRLERSLTQPVETTNGSRSGQRNFSFCVGYRLQASRK